MIRRATEADIGRIVELGAKFHAASPWSYVPYDPVATAAFVGGVLSTGAVFLSDDGMCGGTLAPVYFNPAHVLAVEFFWWAPSDGRALRQAFEAWAKDAGAAEVQFGALADENGPRVAKIYRRAGYEPRETAYTKRVQP